MSVEPVFTYNVNNNQATVTDFTGSAGTLIIPDTLGGHPVVAIGNGAFRDRNDLIAVVIPNSITRIGENAFMGCTNLRNVQLSRNLERLEFGAFRNCINLTSIEIPRSLTFANSKRESHNTRSGIFQNTGLTTASHYKNQVSHKGSKYTACTNS